MDLFVPNDAPLRVLVIDDDPNDVLLLELAFSFAGLSTDLHFVPDGQRAIAYLEGHPPYEDRKLHPPPGLVLLDLKMPKVSGFHVLEWLREHPKRPRMPVAVLTGSDSPDQKALSYALGADAFLVKPCDFAKLTAMMRALVRYCAKLRHRIRRLETTVPTTPDLFAMSFAPQAAVLRQELAAEGLSC